MQFTKIYQCIAVLFVGIFLIFCLYFYLKNSELGVQYTSYKDIKSAMQEAKKCDGPFLLNEEGEFLKNVVTNSGVENDYFRNPTNEEINATFNIYLKNKEYFGDKRQENDIMEHMKKFMVPKQPIVIGTGMPFIIFPYPYKCKYTGGNYIISIHDKKIIASNNPTTKILD